MRRRASTLLGLVLVAAAFFAASIRGRASGDEAARWWAHVTFLASDELEGRDTGSEGHRQAAAYVAEQFKAASLVPAGTSGYLQPVRFTARRIVEAESSLALLRDGKVEPIALGADAT